MTFACAVHQEHHVSMWTSNSSSYWRFICLKIEFLKCNIMIEPLPLFFIVIPTVIEENSWDATAKSESLNTNDRKFEIMSWITFLYSGRVAVFKEVLGLFFWRKNKHSPLQTQMLRQNSFPSSIPEYKSQQKFLVLACFT